MATITKGTTTITPTLVLGWGTTQDANTLLHKIIGRADPDVTLHPSALRSGTFRALFESFTDAEACRVLHTDAPAPMDLVDATVGTLHYVVSGPVVLTAENDPGTAWSVAVGYQEVAP